jgi:hypothetical protein
MQMTDASKQRYKSCKPNADLTEDGLSTQYILTWARAQVIV